MFELNGAWILGLCEILLRCVIASLRWGYVADCALLYLGFSCFCLWLLLYLFIYCLMLLFVDF